MFGNFTDMKVKLEYCDFELLQLRMVFPSWQLSHVSLYYAYVFRIADNISLDQVMDDEIYI